MACSRRGSISTSPGTHSPEGPTQADDRRVSSTSNRAGAGAGAGAEAAVAKALALLPQLLELRPRPAGAVAPVKQPPVAADAVAAAGGATSGGVERKGGGGGGGFGAVVAGADGARPIGSGSGGGSGGGGGSSGGDDELEAVLGALLAVLRRGSASNREAALSALGSKVLPRLGGAEAAGREWLGELIDDEELLVAAIRDRSPRGAGCHQRALGLTYHLLASSPELMSLALEPGCPLLPAVLDALGDGSGSTNSVGGGIGGGGSGSGEVGDNTPGSRVSGGGGGGGSGVGDAPGTPRSAPRTPRLSGMSGDRRGGRAVGVADGEAAGRSGLAVLRIVGLVRHDLTPPPPFPPSLLSSLSPVSRPGAISASFFSFLLDRSDCCFCSFRSFCLRVDED